MPVKLKNIEGALVEKKLEVNQKTERAIGNIEGFNEAIDQIGEREIGLNREKLALIMFKENYLVKDCTLEEAKHKLDMEEDFVRNGYIDLADAIIAKEAEIFEVRK